MNWNIRLFRTDVIERVILVLLSDVSHKIFWKPHIAVAVADDDEVKKWKIRFEIVQSSDRCPSSDKSRYVFEKEFLKIELLKRHYDDILADHFDVKKIVELFSRKYHWSKMIKYVKFYIKTCDICQRTKTFRHFSYDDLQFLFLSQDSWQEIIMNFITNFSSSKRSNDVYDFVFVIINRYIKMTFYIFVTKKITAVELTEIIFDHVIFKYDVSKDVVSNKEFVFTSAY
jgi:hypothetical protein